MAYEDVEYHIHTIQIAHWRLAQFRGAKFIDITAKSGLKPFAPDFANVMKYKRGELGEEEYTRLYLQKMALSQERYPQYWERLLAYPELAVGCYCKPGAYCHRLLFAELAKTYLESKGRQVRLMGEMKNELYNDDRKPSKATTDSRVQRTEG